MAAVDPSSKNQRQGWEHGGGYVLRRRPALAAFIQLYRSSDVMSCGRCASRHQQTPVTASGAYRSTKRIAEHSSMTHTWRLRDPESPVYWIIPQAIKPHNHMRKTSAPWPSVLIEKLPCGGRMCAALKRRRRMKSGRDIGGDDALLLGYTNMRRM